MKTPWWKLLLLYVLMTLAGVALGLCLPVGRAHAEGIPLTVTLSTTGQLSYSFPCASKVTAGRRGDDTVVIRCGGVERLTIPAATVNCRNLKVTQDVKGNPIVRC